ncbi:MAG: ORF6N domain-containing protein [Thermodesulfobacteriota bacterium]|nr:ORF6N domain-containing protein [Thermodesulfobacteriota bacterium]
MDNGILIESIANKIYRIRFRKVMLDRDLAELYGVETKQLKRAVRRNIQRFPKDFMFELSKKETENLRCQSGTSSWGGARYVPMAFTEHGAIMAASVLNSPVAIEASIKVVRAFVQLREVLATHKDLAIKLEKIETKLTNHDEQFTLVFDTIRQLLQNEIKPKNKIGF